MKYIKSYKLFEQYKSESTDFISDINKFISENDWANTIINLHKESNTALNAPYHNLYHNLVVANGCLEGSRYYKLSKDETNNLICAALFHDFNHSAGLETDDYNISESIKSFESWFDNQSNIDSNKVIEIISTTRYPYIKEPKTLSEKIIRDADLSQLFEIGRLEKTYTELAKELGITSKQGIEGTIKFIDEIKPYTEWFKIKLESNKQSIIDKLNEILSKNYESLFESVKFIKQPKSKKDSKTDIYNVSNDGVLVGQIKWSSRMRGYAFLPSKDCEVDVKEFVKELMRKRRAEKKK